MYAVELQGPVVPTWIACGAKLSNSPYTTSAAVMEQRIKRFPLTLHEVCTYLFIMFSFLFWHPPFSVSSSTVLIII